MAQVHNIEFDAAELYDVLNAVLLTSDAGLVEARDRLRERLTRARGAAQHALHADACPAGDSDDGRYRIVCTGYAGQYGAHLAYRVRIKA